MKQANAASASKDHPVPKQGQASSPGTPNDQSDGASAAVVPAPNQSQRRGNTGANEKQRSTKGEEEHTSEWWTALFTGGMLLVAIAQGGFFLWQLVLMRKSVDVSIRAAKATEQSVASIEDTSIRQLRAYVCVEKIHLEMDGDGIPKFTVVTKNCGLTPAHEVRQWIHQWTEKYPLTIDLPTPPEGFPMSVDVLGAGMSQEMRHTRHGPLSPHLAPHIGTKEATIYIYGEIRYCDIFGHHRSTKYRFMYGGDRVVRADAVFPCHSGNEAT